MNNLMMKSIQTVAGTILACAALGGLAASGWDKAHSSYVTKTELRLMSLEDRMHLHELRLQELRVQKESSERDSQIMVHETSIKNIKSETKSLLEMSKDK